MPRPASLQGSAPAPTALPRLPAPVRCPSLRPWSDHPAARLPPARRRAGRPAARAALRPARKADRRARRAPQAGGWPRSPPAHTPSVAAVQGGAPAGRASPYDRRPARSARRAWPRGSARTDSQSACGSPRCRRSRRSHLRPSRRSAPCAPPRPRWLEPPQAARAGRRW